MTEQRRRPQNPGGGWLATAAGALLLVAVGFGVGLLAGTAYEEPELVAEHLAGNTVEVALGAPRESAAEPAPAGDVAAPPPPQPPGAAEADDPLPTPLGAGALDAPRAEPVAPVKPNAATHLPLAVAPPKPGAKGTGFAIQVGAFATAGTAQQLAGELGKRGFPSYVVEEGTGARFKVRVGPIGSRSEAEQLSGRLKSQHQLPTWILAGKS